MKRALAVALTLAFAVAMFAAPAMAGNKAVQHAYGKMITAQCTAFYALDAQIGHDLYGKKVTYGKLWRTVKNESSHPKVKLGARRFVDRHLDELCPIGAPLA